MITLITIFYSFLFPFNESVKPDCQGKLAELNYVYQYDEEPILCQYNNHFKVEKEYCKNGVDSNTIREIENIYKCFRDVEAASPDKVIVITHRTLLDIAQLKPNVKDKEYEVNDGQVIDIMLTYGLLDSDVYFISNPNQLKEVKVELVTFKE